MGPTSPDGTAAARDGEEPISIAIDDIEDSGIGPGLGDDDETAPSRLARDGDARDLATPDGPADPACENDAALTAFLDHLDVPKRVTPSPLPPPPEDDRASHRR